MPAIFLAKLFQARLDGEPLDTPLLITFFKLSYPDTPREGEIIARYAHPVHAELMLDPIAWLIKGFDQGHCLSKDRNRFKKLFRSVPQKTRNLNYSYFYQHFEDIPQKDVCSDAMKIYQTMRWLEIRQEKDLLEDDTMKKRFELIRVLFDFGLWMGAIGEDQRQIRDYYLPDHF